MSHPSPAGAIRTHGSTPSRARRSPEKATAHDSDGKDSRSDGYIVSAVLGLLALFTHVHLFWIGALLLAMIDLPDFGTPLRSIAGSVEKIAGGPSSDVVAEESGEAVHTPTLAVKEEPKPRAPKKEVHGHA